MRPRSEPIKVDVMYISQGVINLAARAVITSGIISDASLISTGINWALSGAQVYDSACNEEPGVKAAHGALLI